MSSLELFDSVTDLVTLNNTQIQHIKDRLPEYHRGKMIVGHSTSQSSYSLQTMQMISDSPYSRLKQCLAQIGKKYSALREAHFKVENIKLEIKELMNKNDDKSRLDVLDKESQIHVIGVSMENALREIGMFQDMYDNIKKSNNIPDNWSEKDYEKSEISNMIKSSFRIAIQDISAYGRVSRAAVEYWEQLGIHPQYATRYTLDYFKQVEDLIDSEQQVSIQVMYNFLDKMAEKFKDSHKLALSRIGLNELGSERFMANGSTKPQ